MARHIHIHIGNKDSAPSREDLEREYKALEAKKSKLEDEMDATDDNNKLTRLRKEYAQLIQRSNELRHQMAK